MRFPLASALVPAAVLLTGLASPVRAADAPVAVLGVEAAEGAPEALAAAITDALRRRVTSTKGMRLVPGRDLVEVKLVFSCPDEAPTCMAQAGKSLGAAKMIFGSVRKSTGDVAGDAYVVTLKMLDTQRAAVDSYAAEGITKAQATDPAIRGPVQKWFATLTGQGAVGIVRVRGDVIGATVSLDGAPAGTLGTEDLVLPGVSAGKHEVLVSKPGRESVRREVSVSPGDTASVEVSLAKTGAAPAAEPLATAAPSATDDPRADPGAAGRDGGGGRTGIKTATWAVLGAGLVGIALGVKFGLDVQTINGQLNEYRRFDCPRNVSPTLLCDKNDKPAKPRNAEEQRYVDLKTEDGERFEMYQYISLGVGGALLATGGYLFYRAYVADDREQASTTPARRIAVLPFVTPTSRGFGLATTF